MDDDFATWDRIATVVDQCAEAAKTDPDQVDAVIDASFRKLRRTQKDAIAGDGFAAMVRDRLRAMTLRAERAASASVSPAAPSEDPPEGVPAAAPTAGPEYGPHRWWHELLYSRERFLVEQRGDPWLHGPPTPKGWHGWWDWECTYELFGAAAAGCECRECAEVRSASNDRRASRDRMLSAIESAHAEYRAALFMEWTEELLASTFALDDGRLVTWGEATVADHESRIAMFERNAHANLEGAARHSLAIERLKGANVERLAELVAA